MTEPVARAARAVPEVQGIEKLVLRCVGTAVFVDILVQADPQLTRHDAHELIGRVKGAIRGAVPAVRGVLVHMEPFQLAPEKTEPHAP